MRQLGVMIAAVNRGAVTDPPDPDRRVGPRSAVPVPSRWAARAGLVGGTFIITPMRRVNVSKFVQPAAEGTAPDPYDTAVILSLSLIHI